MVVSARPGSRRTQADARFREFRGGLLVVGQSGRRRCQGFDRKRIVSFEYWRSWCEASGSVGQSSGVVWLLVQVVNRIQSKRGGYGNSVLFTFENEILRQAVRAGAPMVTTAHALLAMVSLDMQLMAKGRFLRPSLARVNTAGAMLRQNGVSLPCPVGYLDGLSMEGDVLTPDETRQRFGGYGGPPWGRYVTGALDRVALIARETHEECGTNHLLIELLNDEDSAASHLVRSFGADSSEIRRHIQGMF
jgi:hypothetical protein